MLSIVILGVLQMIIALIVSPFIVRFRASGKPTKWHTEKFHGFILFIL